jgi:selenocysteine lyase/cysteine desulfurase
MTQEDQVFVADVMVIDSKQKIMVLSVISRLIGATTEFSAIVKICKYRKLREGHHFISMVVEVHDAPMHDMDCSIRECAHLFHDR